MAELLKERTGLNNASECVDWSWTTVDRALADDFTDPTACLPFIHPDTTTFYWELHFRKGQLAGVDFLHRPALVAKGLAGAFQPPDQILERLVSWYTVNEAARKYCHPSVWLELDGPIVTARGARKQGVSVCIDPRFGRRDAATVPPPSSSALIDLFTGLERACGAPR